MKIPEEFIGCRVRATNTNLTNYGEVLGRIVSLYLCKNFVYILLITNEGTFKRVDIDDIKIHKDDMAKIRGFMVVEESNRFEIMDL